MVVCAFRLRVDGVVAVVDLDRLAAGAAAVVGVAVRLRWALEVRDPVAMVDCRPLILIFFFLPLRARRSAIDMYLALAGTGASASAEAGASEAGAAGVLMFLSVEGVALGASELRGGRPRLLPVVTGVLAAGVLTAGVLTAGASAGVFLSVEGVALGASELRGGRPRLLPVVTGVLTAVFCGIAVIARTASMARSTGVFDDVVSGLLPPSSFGLSLTGTVSSASSIGSSGSI